MTEIPLTGEWSEVDPDMWQYIITAPIGLEVGKTYVVNWNGVEYTVIAKAIDDPSGTGVPYIGIGNEALVGGTDTGEPFGIMETTAEYAEQFDGMYGMAASIDMSGDIPFVIYQISVTIHHLDPKYIKDMYYTEGGDSSVVILPETTLTTVEDEGGVFVLPDHLDIVIGQTYTVNWNGTEYISTCINGGELEVEMAGMSVLTNEGADLTTGEGVVFLIIAIPADQIADAGFGAQIVDMSQALSVTLSITGSGEVVHKIDNKYLDLDWLPTYKLTTIVEETTVENQGTLDGFGTNYLSTPNVVVTMDGVKYPTTIQTMGSGIDAANVCGNLSIGNSDLPNTGEPFLAIV